MSDTPRVDSYVYKFPGCQREPRLIDFARKLERELAEARAEIEQLKSRNNASVSAHMWLIMRHAFTSGAYKGYAHGTEQKLLEQMFKEWCSKDYPEAAEKEVERLTEIERKDKLIEQMAEAIKFSLIADEVRQTRNVCASDINDACETSRVKRIAALSAAERMSK